MLFMLCLCGDLLSVFAEDTPRSGFAIVTLVSGNIAGLITTETLTNTTPFAIAHTTVAPSPLLTSASMIVPVGGPGEDTTGVAITNPSSGTGGVNLLLTDSLGQVVLNLIVPLGPNGHFSRFLNEFFAEQPEFSTPLLLTMSSEIPVAILALNFRPGGDFTAIPLTSLSTPTPVPSQPATPTPTFTTVSAVPGFGIGLPPNPPARIGGFASVLFPQVATGGGWSTEIAIANTSFANQQVRIDFFGPDGLHTASIPNISIPIQGVFFFNTGQAQLVNQ